MQPIKVKDNISVLLTIIGYNYTLTIQLLRISNVNDPTIYTGILNEIQFPILERNSNNLNFCN